MSEIRWGILGTGKIAKAFAAALAVTPGAVLSAVASRELARAAQFGVRAYGSYAELVADADIDIVYIATPHSEHAANARLALEAGKPVLCEKPFTINAREARAVIDCARARGLFMMEAMWTRFLPSMDALRAVLASGEIGVAHALNADFGFPSTFGPEHRLHKRELGGGALLDIGIYPLAVAVDLFGPVQTAKASAMFGPTGVDIQTSFSLVHANGGMSTCALSNRVCSPIELTISGSAGFVRLHTPFYKSTRLSVHLHDGSSRSIEAPYLGNGYVHEALEAMRCLRAGELESPRMPWAESLALMETLDAMRQQIGLVYPADTAQA